MRQQHYSKNMVAKKTFKKIFKSSPSNANAKMCKQKRRVQQRAEYFRIVSLKSMKYDFEVNCVLNMSDCYTDFDWQDYEKCFFFSLLNSITYLLLNS